MVDFPSRFLPAGGWLASSARFYRSDGPHLVRHGYRAMSAVVFVAARCLEEHIFGRFRFEIITYRMGVARHGTLRSGGPPYRLGHLRHGTGIFEAATRSMPSPIS